RICADARSLPFRSASFNGCLMIMLLHQIPESERQIAFRETLRVTRPGGMLIIKTSSPEDLARRSFVRFFPRGLAINLDRYGTIEDLVDRAESAGYMLRSLSKTYTSEVRK